MIEDSQSVRVRRASSLGPTETYLLRQWGRQIREAFGDMPYLVGSAAQGLPWRDIDVRLILPDRRFAELTEADPDEEQAPPEPRHMALNVAFTVWGQRVTGLPIDFQFQSMTVANDYPGSRIPLGLVHLKRGAHGGESDAG